MFRIKRRNQTTDEEPGKGGRTVLQPNRILKGSLLCLSLAVALSGIDAASAAQYAALSTTLATCDTDAHKLTVPPPRIANADPSTSYQWVSWDLTLYRDVNGQRTVVGEYEDPNWHKVTNTLTSVGPTVTFSSMAAGSYVVRFDIQRWWNARGTWTWEESLVVPTFNFLYSIAVGVPTLGYYQYSTTTDYCRM